MAKILSKKYPNYRDDVRIDGTYGYGKVGHEKYYDKDELGNAYIDCYHIDSKEGLIYLLSEIQYYHEKRVYTEKLRKSFYRKQKATIAEVNKRLIEYGNPYKNSEDWLKSHGMVETGDNAAALEILPYLKAFDETVNPFCNCDYEMKSPEQYMDKISFTLYSNATGLLRMKINNKNGQVEHARSRDEKSEYITYSSYYDVDPNKIMNVHHYISDSDKANVICLYKFNRNFSDESTLDIRFDLISGLAYSTYAKDDEKKPITPEQKEIIIQELEKAAAEARKVTLNNMAKKKVNR